MKRIPNRRIEVNNRFRQVSYDPATKTRYVQSKRVGQSVIDALGWTAVEHLKNGNRVLAIKDVMDNKGLSLTDAKNLVDSFF